MAKRFEAHLWQRLTWTKTMTVHVALGGASGSSAVPDFVHPARTARPEASSAESGLDAVADAIAKARRIVVVCGTSPHAHCTYGIFFKYCIKRLLVVCDAETSLLDLLFVVKRRWD